MRASRLLTLLTLLILLQHPQPPQAVREALRMGADMEILEPATLRAAVESEARTIARMHGTNRRRKS